jgi:hypothetical protein
VFIFSDQSWSEHSDDSWSLHGCVGFPIPVSG